MKWHDPTFLGSCFLWVDEANYGCPNRTKDFQELFNRFTLEFRLFNWEQLRQVIIMKFQKHFPESFKQKQVIHKLILAKSGNLIKIAITVLLMNWCWTLSLILRIIFLIQAFLLLMNMLQVVAYNRYIKNFVSFKAEQSILDISSLLLSTVCNLYR